MKNKQKHELAVCGYAAVKALAKINPHKIKRFYYTAQRALEFGFLCKTLAERKIPYNQVSAAAELEKLCGSVHHQGLAAMIELPAFLPVSPAELRDWAQNRENVLIFDNITNAQNAGSIIRSAAFFGVRRIILPAQTASALITTSAYRNAQGGMESVYLYAVRSLPALLHDMDGKLLRLAADVNARTSVREIGTLCKKKRSNSGDGGTETEKAIALVLGNEEQGINESVKKECDYSVCIPGAHGKKGEAIPDSLNVAQAAAVILYEMSAVNGR